MSTFTSINNWSHWKNNIWSILSHFQWFSYIKILCGLHITGYLKLFKCKCFVVSSWTNKMYHFSRICYHFIYLSFYHMSIIYYKTRKSLHRLKMMIWISIASWGGDTRKPSKKVELSYGAATMSFRKLKVFVAKKVKGHLEVGNVDYLTEKGLTRATTNKPDNEIGRRFMLINT